jgi:hypothetical protein
MGVRNSVRVACDLIRAVNSSDRKKTMLSVSVLSQSGTFFSAVHEQKKRSRSLKEKKHQRCHFFNVFV